ncbi:putative ankyrin repeat protein RF_0381 [Halyomorpha halys]|uniref:putative ankyrin repeat protein RF_0381 n=1 Tax=Halyomorpha halys TaxID=286706 RepID=UPI0006D4CAB7|nr:uncharacterized protein LOC106688799 [Halyomorpha halys]
MYITLYSAWLATMKLLILLFLPYVHAQGPKYKPSLFVAGKNNESFRVDGYSSYRGFISRIENLVSHKIKDTYEFALKHTTIAPSALFSQTTPEKLILLQLLQSFDLKNKTFDKFLLNVANLCTFDPPQKFRTWFSNNFDFPSERVYQMLKFIANTNPVLHKAIANQIFYLNVKYKVFEKAVATGDVEVVKWLLEHSSSEDFPIESKIIEDAWKSSRIKIIVLLMKYNKISKQNLPVVIVNERFRNNETFLHIASRFGYTEMVSLLILNIGANVNVKDVEGRSPLYRAVEYNHYPVIEILAVRGADLKTEPLLALAIQKGYIDSIKSLLNYRAPFQVKDSDGELPFFIAANQNNVNIFEILNSIKGPKYDIISSTNDFGDTLMHVAASKGFMESVKTLYFLGIPVNAINNFGESVLYKAVESQNVKLINFLIENKADITIPTIKGDTIMHLAASLGNLEIVKYLSSKKVRSPVHVRNAQGETPVYKAAISGNSEVLKYLVGNGGDLLSHTEGMTMLHDAAAEGNERAVTCLIDSGMSVDVLGFWDVTPLHLAISNGHRRIVEKLLENGANANSKTKNLWTPLHRAVLIDDPDIIQLLINSKADTTVQNGAGDIPLTLAEKNNKKKAANVLRLFPKEKQN